MIKRKDEHKTSVRENAFGAPGSLDALCLIETPEELYGKGRLFNICTLQPGSGVGYHVHNGDAEFYHVLSGEGEYSDNGTLTVLKTGDTAFCPAGEGHSLLNTGSEPMQFIALIVYK